MATLNTWRLRRAAVGSDTSTRSLASGPKIACTASGFLSFTAAPSFLTASSGVENVGCFGVLDVHDSAGASAAHRHARTTARRCLDSSSASAPSAPAARNPPPPPRDPPELLRLRSPRELAARSDFPLE